MSSRFEQMIDAAQWFLRWELDGADPSALPSSMNGVKFRTCTGVPMHHNAIVMKLESYERKLTQKQLKRLKPSPGHPAPNTSSLIEQIEARRQQLIRIKRLMESVPGGSRREVRVVNKSKVM